MKKVRIFNKITDCVLNVLIVLFALFLLASIYSFIQVKILKNDHSSLFGYSLFEIQTGSMHGSIEVGDWILVKNDLDVKVGDVITFKQEGNFITHRVVEAYQDSFITKGDANSAKDKPIDRSQIVGKVKKVLHSFGFLKKTIFNPIVIIFMIITFYFISLYLNAGKKSSNKILNKYIGMIKTKLIKFKHRNDTIKVTNVTETDKQPEENLHPNYSDVFADDDEEEEPEDEMSKTILFRKVTVDDESGDVVEVNESEKVKEEDLSKTAVLRIVKIEDDDYELNTDENIAEKPINSEEPKTNKKELVLEAEEIEEEEPEKVITKEYLKEKIDSKKAKNIVDKLFIIKNIMYNEIIDALLVDEYSYIRKSSFRNDFIKNYMYLKYFSSSDERKSFKALFLNNKKELIKENQNDDTKTKAIDLYYKACLLIYDIEDKKSVDITKDISKYFKNEKINNISNNVKVIIKYSNEIMNDIIKKFETSSFTAVYNRFKEDSSYNGVYLDYNIQFSKVYSKYIVDKTYTEGVVSEDKISVLLNLVSCKVVKDILNGNYNSRYFVYIPSPLYGKDKKLDRIVSIIENDYAKNHIIITSTVSNIIKNNDDIMRLRKKGYSFALVFDEYKDYASEELAYIFMADYYFIDEKMDKSKLLKGIPKQISDKVITDNIKKRIGECK